MRTRSLYETEYRVRRADGEYRNIAVRGVPVIEPDGAIREWVGTCTDITEKKKADEQLKTLNETLEQRATQLRALATELTLAEHQERKRVAQILHDNLQQLLVGTKLGISSIREKNKTNEPLIKNLGELDVLLNEAVTVCRSLAVELSPPVLSDLGLAAAVKWLGEEMKRVHGLEVQVTAEDEIPTSADGIVLLLFQAVRELLFNIVKHAGVKSAAVRVSRLADHHVEIEVTDEGAGFDHCAIASDKASATGLGLFGIQERIAHMGGRVEVESAPGRGTRVTLHAEIRPPVGAMQEQARSGSNPDGA